MRCCRSKHLLRLLAAPAEGVGAVSTSPNHSLVDNLLLQRIIVPVKSPHKSSTKLWLEEVDTGTKVLTSL
jgi:hypothetical protein